MHPGAAALLLGMKMKQKFQIGGVWLHMLMDKATSGGRAKILGEINPKAYVASVFYKDAPV